MGATDYILAVYAVSGTLALGCSLLPGAGLVGRLVNIMAGIGLLGWTANVYLRDGWFIDTPVVLVVPLALVAYAAVTMVSLQRHAEHEPCLARVGRQAMAPPATQNRRGPGRRTLPGEYSSTPINHAPPPHDPWAALYASTEREQMRGHARPSPSPDPAMTAVAYGARHADHGARRAEYEALRSTYANAQAEYEAWQERCMERNPDRGSWPDDWSEPDEWGR
ncbi:MAG: hypothetical protein JXA67_10275 [Micromonosporaceae bacterium]|nr:hypothetical protein [Micromonosporaceae bacterium]